LSYHLPRVIACAAASGASFASARLHVSNSHSDSGLHPLAKDRRRWSSIVVKRGVGPTVARSCLPFRGKTETVGHASAPFESSGPEGVRQQLMQGQHTQPLPDASQSLRTAKYATLSHYWPSFHERLRSPPGAASGPGWEPDEACIRQDLPASCEGTRNANPRIHEPDNAALHTQTWTQVSHRHVNHLVDELHLRHLDRLLNLLDHRPRSVRNVLPN
jgi:hypothetical protein